MDQNKQLYCIIAGGLTVFGISLGVSFVSGYIIGRWHEYKIYCRDYKKSLESNDVITKELLNEALNEYEVINNETNRDNEVITNETSNENEVIINEPSNENEVINNETSNENEVIINEPSNENEVINNETNSDNEVITDPVDCSENNLQYGDNSGKEDNSSDNYNSTESDTDDDSLYTTPEDESPVLL